MNTTVLVIAGFLIIILPLIFGIRRGVWILWPVIFLMLPEWNFRYLYSITITPRFLLLSIATIPLFLLRTEAAPGQPNRKFFITDLIILMSFLENILSCIVNGQLGPATVATAPTVYFPYILGRSYLASRDDLQRAAVPIAWTTAICSLLALLECSTKTNFFALLTDHVPYSSGRFGFMRAQGNQGHPISLGGVFLLLLPWSLLLAHQARQGQAARAWRFVPWLNTASILSCLSRGPVLALAIAAYIRYVWQRPRIRVPLLLIAAVLATIAFANLEAIADYMGSLVNDTGYNEYGEQQVVTIGDQEVAYSGTKHRLLLWDYYKPFIDQAPILGHAHIPRHLIAFAFGKFWSIDSQYVLTLINWGYIGLFLFIALIIASTINCARVSLKNDDLLSPFAIALMACLVATAFEMYTVAVSGIFDMFLFCAGLSVNLLRLPAEPEPEPEECDNLDQYLEEEDQPDPQYAIS